MAGRKLHWKRLSIRKCALSKLHTLCILILFEEKRVTEQHSDPSEHFQNKTVTFLLKRPFCNPLFLPKGELGFNRPGKPHVSI